MIDGADLLTLAPVVGIRAACAAVGEARARWYRRHRKSPAAERPDRVRDTAAAGAVRGGAQGGARGAARP